MARLASEEGLFCEPSSAAGLAAVLRGDVEGERVVVTITGHGLKDPAAADRSRRRPSSSSPTPTPSRAPRAETRRRAVIVRAPATSANLGPAFDCAAVALELWNELEVTDGDGVVVEGEGAGELAADATNLAVRAYALLADPAGKRFRFTNRIPLERGLGSSAAAIALGLAAARPDGDRRGAPRRGARAREPRRQPRRRARRRRHPRPGRDASPASPRRCRSRPSRSCPRERTSTEASRRSLPSTVAHADAAANAGRAALLAAGAAAGDAELFAAGLDDRLHEPYRPSAALDAIRADLPDGARGATLSGSGPTVIVWADDAGGVRRARSPPGSRTTTCSSSRSSAKGAL